MFSFLLTENFIVIVHLFIFYFFVSFLLIMTFDLKAQPASISSAICGLRRIIIVFSFFQTTGNKMENGNGSAHLYTVHNNHSPSGFLFLALQQLLVCGVGWGHGL